MSEIVIKKKKVPFWKNIKARVKKLPLMEILLASGVILFMVPQIAELIWASMVLHKFDILSFYRISNAALLVSLMVGYLAMSVMRRLLNDAIELMKQQDLQMQMMKKLLEAKIMSGPINMGGSPFEEIFRKFDRKDKKEEENDGGDLKN
jgi:hypothetical protein